LLLFTDGLVEVRGADLDDGLSRLTAAVVARASAPLDSLVDGVLADLVGPAGAEDDIAVVAIRPLPAPLTAQLPADPAQLRLLRRAIATWAADVALPADAVQDLQLVVGEAVANAVEHAYRDPDRSGSVDVELAADRGGGVAVTIRDSGTWRAAPADPGSRGRGLQIIGALATDVDLVHGESGTVISFRLPAPAAAQAASRPGVADVAPSSATLNVTDAGSRRCLELAGDLDLAGVEELRGALLADLSAGRPTTVDLTRLGFVTSVGAGLLLDAVHTAADVTVVLPTGGPARHLLDITGLTGVLRGTGRPAPR
jgi:anti-sigma regulatory factor (Ser/Thr protein kinase)/anti-anti-sigma regulatory factor